MTTNLGEQHGSTLFVSNLPYTATSTDLQTLFSDIAPVRSAFVVTEQGTGLSKGVGYVSFSLKEGAQAAFESIDKNGLELVGRKLRVQWAENKKQQEKEKGEEQPKPQRTPTHTNDPLSIRTIIISGLPSSLDPKVLWKKIRKYKGAEKVEFSNEHSNTVHVLFSTPSQASQAISKLHAHVYKGSLLSVTLKKRLEGLAKPGNNNKTSTGAGAGAGAPTHASRLIVRNLPFNISEQDLRAIFLPYGPIYEIHIPTTIRGTEDPSEAEVGGNPSPPPSRSKKPESQTQTQTRTRGFAFIWMLSKKDAERAMKGCNGMLMRAGMARSLVLDKQKKKKERRLEMKKRRSVLSKGSDGVGEDVEMEMEMEMEGADGDGEKGMERVIAVDWALSKDRWKEEQAKMEVDDASGSSSSSSDDEEDGLGVHSGSGDDSDDASSSDSEDENDHDEQEERVKPQLPHPETGSTVFIRNIPFDATEDELRTLFRSFGPLRYARITKDQETGRSRGTGFACFWNKEDADGVVRQSELLHVETTGQSTIATKKTNPFTLPSILTPDPSSSLAQSLVLHGRTLDVVMAVTRDAACKLKEENERARRKVDKRNMYLLKEGVILPNSPGAERLTPTEIDRRTNSFNGRRALLKSNPSLYISQTRLSVRQIPTFVTERMLRRLAVHSIRSFDEEVKRGGVRDPLSVDELVDGEIDGDLDDEKKKKKKGKKASSKARGIRQVKIVRQTDRIDPTTGKGKSKGYGFVEMYKHSDALKFLRWANNNPEVTQLFSGDWWKEELEGLLKVEEAKSEGDRDGARVKRLKEEIERLRGGGDGEGLKRVKSGGTTTLIVEFSIENVQVVQRRNVKQRNDDRGKAVNTQDSEVTKVTGKKRKREPDERPESRPAKKRLTVLQAEGEVKTDKARFANPVGSIIGRKRKERKKVKKS